MTDTTETPGEDFRRRVDRLMGNLDEIAELQEEVKLEYLAAKAAGYDVPAMKAAIKIARMDDDGRYKAKEKLVLTDTYLAALGIQLELPLGEAMPHIEDAGNARLDYAIADPMVSINGGPEVPMSVVKQAVDVVKTRKAKPKKRAPKKKAARAVAEPVPA